MASINGRMWREGDLRPLHTSFPQQDVPQPKNSRSTLGISTVSEGAHTAVSETKLAEWAAAPAVNSGLNAAAKTAAVTTATAKVVTERTKKMSYNRTFLWRWRISPPPRPASLKGVGGCRASKTRTLKKKKKVERGMEQVKSQSVPA